MYCIFSYYYIFCYHTVFHVICDIHMCAIKCDMLFVHLCIFSCDTYMGENTGKLEPGIQHKVQVQDSNQSANPHSLIRVCLNNVGPLTTQYALCAHQRQIRLSRCTG